MPTKTTNKNIPHGWSKTHLGDCLQKKPDYGINAASTEYSDDLPAYLRITDISDDGLFLPEKKTSVDHINSKEYFLDDGDMVFARTGASVGKTYLYNENDGELIFAGFLIRIKPNINKLLPGFINAYTRTSKYWQWVKETSPRSGQPGINSVEYASLKLLLPPLPEQSRIVAVLETWDGAIETLTQKIEHKKNIKKGLMQDLLTGKKRSAGFSGGWEKVALSNIGNFFKGMGILKDQVTEIGYNAVRYGELYTKYDVKIEKVFSRIPADVIPSAQKIQYGDILFAGSGETIDEIGKSASYLIKEDGYAGGDIIIFRPKKADSLFLGYFFNTGEARKKLRELGQGQAVVHLYKSDIEELSFYLPEKDEQIAISNILNGADQEITALEKKLSLLRDQKKYLLNILITGEIRTPEDLTLNF